VVPNVVEYRAGGGGVRHCGAGLTVGAVTQACSSMILPEECESARTSTGVLACGIRWPWWYQRPCAVPDVRNLAQAREAAITGMDCPWGRSRKSAAIRWRAVLYCGRFLRAGLLSRPVLRWTWWFERGVPVPGA